VITRPGCQKSGYVSVWMGETVMNIGLHYICVFVCVCVCVFPRPHKISVKVRTNNFTKHKNTFFKQNTNTCNHKHNSKAQAHCTTERKSHSVKHGSIQRHLKKACFFVDSDLHSRRVGRDDSPATWTYFD